jgi:hypothetical protein
MQLLFKVGRLEHRTIQAEAARHVGEGSEVKAHTGATASMGTRTRVLGVHSRGPLEDNTVPSYARGCIMFPVPVVRSQQGKEWHGRRRRAGEVSHR